MERIERRLAQLQIKTKKLLRGAHTGTYVTRRIGTGSDFDQLRDYQVGDNVRAIDWKSSARSNKLIVRSYREDRNRTIIVLVDCSRSACFSSGEQLKQTVIQDIAVMLCFAAQDARDRIGAIFFDHAVARVVPLGSGRTHTMGLAQEVLTHVNTTSSAPFAATDIAQACSEMLARFPHNALVVLLSDGISTNYERVISVVAQRHELVVMRVYDPVERALPASVLVQCQDPETGLTVAGTDPLLMQELRRFTTQWHAEQDLFLKKIGVDCCDINVAQPYDELLMKFFAQRCV